MASDIVITPNRGSTTVNAKIDFTGASTASSQIRLEVLPDNSLSFVGTTGSLFSIADSVTGSLMSVNDASGLPILEVFDTDKVVMGQYNQNTLVVNGTQVGIGTGSPTNKLTIAGVNSNGITLTGSNATITAAGTTPNLILSAGTNIYMRPSSGYDLIVDTGNGINVTTGNIRAPAFYYSSDTNSRWVNGYQLYLRGTSPTIWFRDTDQNSAMIHVNSNIFYILRGANDTETWTQVNSRWPMEIDLTNNNMAIGGNLNVAAGTGTVTAATFSGALSGNATTATTLQTARNLTINGTARSFNGSADISWTAADIGLTSYLPLTGGTISSNLTITGNLTVNGTTTTVNSTTTTLDDPIITLGGDTAPGSDDNKDRGVEFRWHNGTAAKVGFFGYDDSTGYFTFIPDSTNTSEVFSGTQGDIQASNFRGNLIGNVTGNVSGTAGGETLATVTGRGASTASQISVSSASGGSMFTGTKAGGTYSDQASGATFKSILDNTNGSAGFGFVSYYGGSSGTIGASIRADGFTTLTYNPVASLANNAFSITTGNYGSLHFDNGEGTTGNARQTGITWRGGSTNVVQAGIYVSQNSTTGTTMALATTDNYSTGPQIGMTISTTGVVNFPRNRPTYAGNVILDAANYNSYAPTLTGTGASGTWGISITGNAATATSADQIDGVAFRNTGSNAGTAADSLEQNGITYVNSNISLLGQTDGALFSQAYNSNWQHQIYGDYRTGQIVVRGKNNGTWQSWRTVLDSSNYTSYTGHIGNGTLTLNTSGSGISGSASFTANQSGNTTFTVTSNATASNTASTIMLRGSSNEVYIGDVYSSNWFRNVGANGLYNSDHTMHWYAEAGYYNVAGGGSLTYGGIKFRAGHASTFKGSTYWDADGFGLLNQGGNWAVRINAASGYAGGSLYGVWDKRNASNTGTSVAIPGMFVQAGSTGAPSAIQNGDLWWNTETGKLKIWYSTSSAWVDATSVPDLANYFPVAGGNITGNVSIGGLLNTTGNITARNGQTHSLSMGHHPSYGTSWAGVWRTGSDYALITNSSDTLVNAPTGSVGFRVANTQYAHVATDGVHTSYWFRNDANNTGLYNTNTTQHLSSQANGYWDMSSTTTVSAIRLYTGGHLSALRGYVYANTSNDIGFLEPGGGWRLRIVGGDYLQGDGSSIRGQMFYDSNDTTYWLDPAADTASAGLSGRMKSSFTINHQGSSSGYGLALYPAYNTAGNLEPTYGMMFASSSTFGAHGAVATGDWATYFTMSNTDSRGWIFRKVGSGNVASISGSGRMRVQSLGVNSDPSATAGTIVTSGAITAGSFVKSGGAANELLKADGFVELETNYVKINNTQTISGLKTFSSQVNLSDSLFFDNFGITTGIYFRSASTNRLVIWYSNNTAVIGAGTGVDVTIGATNPIRIKSATGAIECASSVTATSFIKSSGTSSQFLKADGSVDSSTYLTTAVTSLTGTANQVTVSASTGSVTLSLPQSINTGANIQFGSLGIGTGASGTTGEIRATNNITAYYSDDRLKTKLGAIENPIEKVKALSGFYFEANETAVALGYQKKREVGVSAQEVQVILPEIIAPAPIDDKYMTVRYEKLIPLLIEAIKAQQAQIEELQKFIKEKA